MKRTVALLDILGFRAMIENESTNNLGKRFSDIVGQGLSAMNRPRERIPGELMFFPNLNPTDTYCTTFIFSDTVILISKSDSEIDCLALLIYCWKAMQLLIGGKFPVRGAVTHGEMYVNEKQNLFLGSALTSAYELEQKQNWIGAVIDQSVSDAFPEVLIANLPSPSIRTSLFPVYQVPMKSGQIQSYHTINWRYNLDAIDGTKSFFNDDDEWSVKAKIENTLTYAHYIRQNDLAYPEDEKNTPTEVRGMLFGQMPRSGKLPTHGDEY